MCSIFLFQNDLLGCSFSIQEFFNKIPVLFLQIQGVFKENIIYWEYSRTEQVFQEYSRPVRTMNKAVIKADSKIKQFQSMPRYSKSFLIDEVTINFALGRKLKCTGCVFTTPVVSLNIHEGVMERILPEPRGLLKKSDRAQSARTLFLRRPRGSGIIRFNAPFHCFRTNKLTNCCKIFSR